MLFAALGDIHGNLPALENALHQIDDEGIQTIVCTGDLVAGAPWSNDVVDIIRTREIHCVQGELDRLTVRYHRKRSNLAKRVEPATLAAIERAFEQVSSANLEFLRGLPRTLELTREGIGIAVCHGTLNSQSESLMESSNRDFFMRQREMTTAAIIVCGRAHHAFHAWVEGTLFVNPGTLGDPDGEPTFALINTETDPWEVEIQHVDTSQNQR